MEFVSQNRFCLHLEPELKIREIKRNHIKLKLNIKCIYDSRNRRI